MRVTAIRCRTELSPTRQSSLVDYIYEEPVEEIFNGLVPRYLEAEIFRILLESAAAEHAARMTAMDSATRNASELIDKLTLRDEQDPPGGNHEGIDRNRQRRCIGDVVARSGDHEGDTGWQRTNKRSGT